MIAAVLAEIALLSKLTGLSFAATRLNSAASSLYADAACPKAADTWLTLAPTKVLLRSIDPDWHTRSNC